MAVEMLMVAVECANRVDDLRGAASEHPTEVYLRRTEELVGSVRLL